ncbi:uncharacterized protein [Diadema setosum]|uniref:uncharacterized protein n=1 Tax=Diadema setosum TaxID=31175 RepID=UPI003B39FB24
MHVASTKRCAAVAGSTGSPSMQRRAAPAAEAPKRRCPAGQQVGLGQQSALSDATKREPPHFPATGQGKDNQIQVEVRSGSVCSLISETAADMLGLEILVDGSGYEDYIDAPIVHSGDLPEVDIVGIVSCTLYHYECDLMFNGFVVDDHVMNDGVDVLAGADFMEQNDIAVRPSKGQIMFGDDTMYTYSLSDRSAGYDSRNTHHAQAVHVSVMEKEIRAHDYNEFEFECEMESTEDAEAECKPHNIQPEGVAVGLMVKEAKVQDPGFECEMWNTEDEEIECVLLNYDDGQNEITAVDKGVWFECEQKYGTNSDSDSWTFDPAGAVGIEVCGDVESPNMAIPSTEPSSVPPFIEHSSVPPFTEPRFGPLFTEPRSVPPSTEPSSGPPSTEPRSGPLFTEPRSVPPSTEPSSGPRPTEPSSGPPSAEPSSVPPFTEPSSVTLFTESSTNIFMGNTNPHADIDNTFTDTSHQPQVNSHIHSQPINNQGHYTPIDNSCNTYSDPQSHNEQYQFVEATLPKGFSKLLPSQSGEDALPVTDHVPLPKVSTHMDIRVFGIDRLCASHGSACVEETTATFAHQPVQGEVPSSTGSPPGKYLTPADASPSCTPRDSEHQFMMVFNMVPKIHPEGSTAYNNAVRLRPPMNDVGIADRDTHPTWKAPPRHNGPCLSCLWSKGDPSPSPDDGVSRAFYQMIPTEHSSDDPQAPTHCFADVGIMDVLFPCVLWIPHPSAPPDSSRPSAITRGPPMPLSPPG